MEYHGPPCKTAPDSIAKKLGGETFVPAEIDDSVRLCSSDKRGLQRAEFATVKRMDKPMYMNTN